MSSAAPTWSLLGNASRGFFRRLWDGNRSSLSTGLFNWIDRQPARSRGQRALPAPRTIGPPPPDRYRRHNFEKITEHPLRRSAIHDEGWICATPAPDLVGINCVFTRADLSRDLGGP